jgi:hypothetical protein
MLSLKEIIHADIDPSSLTKEKLGEELELLLKVNKVRARWNQAMTVTSGVRTLKEHLRIYASKGVVDQSKIPMKSKHLETVTNAAAVDIADPGLKITAWLKANPDVLEEADLYCEDGNSNWIHFQNRPFGSYKPGGTRWFKP